MAEVSEAYVARGRLHHGGVKDGVNNEVWYEDGDEIDNSIFTEKDIATALQAGAIVPKAVYDALQKAEEARVQAEQAQVDAEARLLELQHITRTGGSELTAMQDEEITDKERVEQATQSLVDRTEQALNREPVEQTPPSKVATPKVATPRSKEAQPTEAPEKGKS